MSEQEKMHSGEFYLPNDPTIMAKQVRCQELLYDFNQTRPSQFERRQELLEQMFAKVGPHVYFEPPLHANWGGQFCEIGD